MDLFPKTTRRFTNQPSWLPEIYQIGVRNPQGMVLSPFDSILYIFLITELREEILLESVNPASGNYGWKVIGWGGVNYFNGTKIGDGEPFKEEFNKPLLSWVPSIAPSNIQFYNGSMFNDWRGEFACYIFKISYAGKIRN